MTENTVQIIGREVDSELVVRLVSPLRWEMGTRNFQAGRMFVRFQVGMGSSTCWVEITRNSWDLFDVSIFKARAGRRTEVGSLSDIAGDQLAQALLGEWCEACSRKGW